MVIFIKAVKVYIVKNTQIIEGKNSTFFLAFSHPDWFLPYTATDVGALYTVNTLSLHSKNNLNKNFLFFQPQ